MNSIRRTFQHLPGIGAKREAELRKKGIEDWSDLSQNLPFQFELFRGGSKSIEAEVALSEEALLAGDIGFFADRLPRSELHRIATSFPSKCVFLDIETTGLSSYYDIVTLVGWSVCGKYFAEVAPSNLDSLLATLDENPIIVTFNGALFDLPFLSKHFEIDWSKYLHIDLRFLAKRVDLTGGQKQIESEILLQRAGALDGVDGAEAVTLWFDYKEGDIAALKRLIEYNHADVEGMKRIFEVSTSRLNAPDSIQEPKQSPEIFLRSSVNFSSNEREPNLAGAVAVKSYVGEVGPRLALDQLVAAQPKIGNASVVGIDLTGSEKRASGWAVVRGDEANWRLIGTDNELVAATIASNPTLVSIDSPLSLPQGRIHEFDDDPGRDEFGIVRLAERQLRKRGINSYPALLPSMQKLTRRGIEIANLLRRQGIPVIESYPGAAQDILGIPRKQKGLKYLTRGLARFGYSSVDSSESVSHDELDALTSALVGQFMLAGYWEGLGSDEEDFMIVPTTQIKAEQKNLMAVVGISGALASGKTTAGKFLETRGFQYCRFSQILADELVQQNRPVTRENLQSLGAETRRSRFAQRKLHLAIAKQTRGAKKIVIDGLRHPEDHAFLFENWGFKAVHLHIDATENSRRERLLKREKPGDIDLSELDRHEVEENHELLRNLAQGLIRNDQTLEIFEQQLMSTMEALYAN